MTSADDRQDANPPADPADHDAGTPAQHGAGTSVDHDAGTPAQHGAGTPADHDAGTPAGPGAGKSAGRGSGRPTTRRSRTEAHHQHRDVSGGWLRPAVFGAMDGLVTNVSLIAGVGGGGGNSRALILTGLAGLAAGALSMATGEYVSVSSQNELIGAEVSKERYELEHNPDAERRELAAVFRGQGVDADLADRVARQVSVRPEQALRLHVREELGVDHHELPSPLVAAGASLVTFAAGALIPLLPYLLGFSSLLAVLVLAGLAAFVGGGMVSRITERPFLRGAVRQLVLASVAAGLTYAIGTAVGATVH
jgi:VIT1/CCC1 family predicted Fe2+/Mn2+ transporter